VEWEGIKNLRNRYLWGQMDKTWWPWMWRVRRGMSLKGCQVSRLYDWEDRATAEVVDGIQGIVDVHWNFI
jgi:hypothetical protein